MQPRSSDRQIMDQILKEEAFFLNQKHGDIHSFILDDDQDQLLNKLLNINKLSPIDRENYTKHISYCIRNLGQKGIEKLPLIMEKYKKEDERFQIMFIEQLNLIYENVQDDKGQEIVIQALSYFLLNSILKIKEIAGQQLTKIALHLKGDEKGNVLLPTIIKMAHDDGNEDNRIVGLQLMGKLSTMFGAQLSESFIAFEIMSLGQDSKPQVRKEAVNQLPQVAKVVSKDFFNKKLFPFYLTKCKESNTKVKTSCVEHFLQIVELATQQQKIQELTIQILTFQNDSNKTIKGVAFRCLARFIASIDSEKIEPKLIDQYLKMADSDIRELLQDQQVMFACAYGFPAVLKTVGIQRWPQLHKLFNQLWKQKNERICKTLAASLHEVAKIIGAEKSEQDLFPVLENIFVKEPNDNVLIGCVKNLTQFLKIFSDEKKESLLEIFFFIQKDQKKWRIREQIANQLEDMAQIFPPDILFRMIIPIAFKLCSDSVSQVRKVASQKIHAFFEGIKSSPAQEQYKLILLESMKGFQKSSAFFQRQSFVTMCFGIIINQQTIFLENLLQPFLELANDKVINVRYALYTSLENLIISQGTLSKNELLVEAFLTLSNDEKLKPLIKTHKKSIEQPKNEQFLQPVPQPKQEDHQEEPQLEELDDDEIPQRQPRKEPEILKQLQEEKLKEEQMNNDQVPQQMEIINENKEQIVINEEINQTNVDEEQNLLTQQIDENHQNENFDDQQVNQEQAQGQGEQQEQQISEIELISQSDQKDETI